LSLALDGNLDELELAELFRIKKTKAVLSF